MGLVLQRTVQSNGRLTDISEERNQREERSTQEEITLIMGQGFKPPERIYNGRREGHYRH